MISESTDIRFLKGVGEKRAEKLHKLGIFNVGDLLRYYPRDYRDLSKVTEIKDAVTDEKCCIKAIVGKNAVGARIRKGLTIYKTEVTDGTGVLETNCPGRKRTAGRKGNCFYLPDGSRE